MHQNSGNLATARREDLLKINLGELPYFRALLRAVESRFYSDLRIENPVLDVGCGDGHFAKVDFFSNSINRC